MQLLVMLTNLCTTLSIPVLIEFASVPRSLSDTPVHATFSPLKGPELSSPTVFTARLSAGKKTVQGVPFVNVNIAPNHVVEPVMGMPI